MEKKRDQEKKVVSLMIRLYCMKYHKQGCVGSVLIWKNTVIPELTVARIWKRRPSAQAAGHIAISLK